ncbi:hypothetical protein ASE95_03040 [Sphingomonas sp. Leaf231]|uniref:hypothetical protein n=1 Tax=Sphingomonas sp. Leaf231 TaxID=1736301 RepID=UPI0006F2B773|nr:hypothetical protein [Sphingomonas sp. Leaf231]KQN93892.1 hypothetical protein ASE95_03040 [Sphingomonas sp. Leaf231]
MTDLHKDHNGADDQHGRIREGVDQARDAAAHALDSARHRASDAAHATAETIETNPLGVLVGGLVLGAIVAAILPRSQREKELLSGVGRKINAAAVAAVAAAKDAGRSELDGLGLTPNAARDQAKSLFQGVLKAASTAGTAAAQAGKEQVKSTS